MTTFRERKNKDGSISITARIRRKRQGQIVFEEAETFTGRGSKKQAELWAANREVEVKSGKSISNRRER